MPKVSDDPLLSGRRKELTTPNEVIAARNAINYSARNSLRSTRVEFSRKGSLVARQEASAAHQGLANFNNLRLSKMPYCKMGTSMGSETIKNVFYYKSSGIY